MKGIEELDIIVIGTGMYVCGRGTDSYGTVLPAIYEWSKRNDIGELHIAGTNPDSISTLKENQNQVENMFDCSIKTNYYPTERIDNRAYIEALEEASSPCCAIVVVPDHLHFEITREVIEHGIPPLVVKPLSSSTEKVEKLTELRDKHDLFAAVEFHKRFDRSNRLLRDKYRSNAIGDPLYFLVQYSQRKSIPETQFQSWVEQTNIFQYLGPHYVDIIHHVTGAEPVEVTARGQKKYLKNKGYDTHDAIEVLVTWQLPNGSNFESCFLVNWVDPEVTSAMSDQRITLVGTAGRVEADQKRRGIQIVTEENDIEEPNPDFCQSYGEPGTQSFTYEGYGIDSFTTFLDVVSDPTNPMPESADKLASFEDAMISTAVIEAVNECLDSETTSRDVKYPKQTN